MPSSQAVRLIADFKADLLVMARQHLAEHWAAGNIPENEVLPKYFDSLRRWPAARPRRVWEADDFTCPREVAAGWALLRERVLKGEDIRPHLAREHSALDYRDGLLNEWNINHLHLGIKPYFKDPSYVARTSQLAFALITDDDFYAINIYRRHGDWESSNIIESVHRNWPEVIRRYRINGVPGESLNNQGRKMLRGSNVQTFTTVSDGTVYAPIHGGVACSGVSVEAVMRGVRACADITRLQSAMQEQTEKFAAHLRLRGYPDGKDVRATLVGVSNGRYQILFPEYALQANVKLEEDAAGDRNS
jgi:hypothetical protein